jgi:glucosamine--fructose-6-phosphate aminotransferase (isomerizing)
VQRISEIIYHYIIYKFFHNATEGDEHIKQHADHVIYIPHCEEAMLPLIASVPLQLLSYHVAVMRGCNVDQPRNLAKSVTVE